MKLNENENGEFSYKTIALHQQLFDLLIGHLK